MNQKERMLAGLPYKGWLDGLSEERLACKKKVYALNQLPPERRGEIPACRYADGRELAGDFRQRDCRDSH